MRMTYLARLGCASVVALLGGFAALAHAATPPVGKPGQISFNRDIRPILSDNCFTCHGPDKGQRKANLRLDIEAEAKRDLGGYHAIKPGEPGDSEMIALIFSKDPDEIMPPPEAEKTLSDAQKKLLAEWIKQGAPWEAHWAYLAPKRWTPPKVRNGAWVRNPIDAFILANLESLDLTPSREADRVTLIRRLSFDLIGLPPTPAEVDAFVNDKSPDAYEKLVDRLLASPHFGERMAIQWLDLVRYADTVGYHGDQNVEASPFRDYVINAFNANMPFDQFTTEQLAGDLLDNPSLWQKVASGYNRLGMMSAEGGVQPKEYLAKYAAERVRNVSTVWMGATMGCAECHDHKFDPYSMKDFYSMAAFFADIKERGIYGGSNFGPFMSVPSDEDRAAIARIDKRVAELTEAMKTPSDAELAAMKAWEEQMRTKLQAGGKFDYAWLTDKQTPDGQRNGSFDYVDAKKGPVREGTTFSRKQTGNGIVQHFVIDAKKDKLKLAAGETFYAWVHLHPKKTPKTVMLQFNVNGSWDHRVFWGEDKISFGGIGNVDQPGHRRVGDLPETGKWVRLEATPEQVGLKPGDEVNGIAFTQFDGLAHWSDAGLVRNGTGLNPDEETVLQTPAENREAHQRQKLLDAFRRTGGYDDPRATELAKLRSEKERIEKGVRQMVETVAVAPREMRVLPRGDWMNDSGEVVQPAAPHFLPQLDIKDRRPTRMDLANWLTRRDNPLTARTFVNRLWATYFGTGIVKNLDDLGLQGEPPVHPELLDWLAVEFMDRGWDVKHMIKLLVTSATYRQSSLAPTHLREVDPYNRLLARQSRFRLDAEIVRDNALAISGLLVDDIGGDSAKPYQPAGYYRHLNFPKREYKRDTGEGLYRRGVYTHWQRQFLHPMLKAFDAPSRDECAVDRPRSNTPLAALVLLNDPSFVEAARVFAERALREGGDSDKARLTWMYRWTLSREPEPREVEVLTTLLKNERDKYAADKDAAKKLIGTGDWPTPQDLDVSEHAAWTMIARALLNMHETITRN